MKIPTYKIRYDAVKKKVHLKVGGKEKIKYVPTDKGIVEISNKIDSVIKRKKLKLNNTYLRIFNYSRKGHLLKYGNDRADSRIRRDFDETEWELYSFRLIRDYMYQNRQGEFLDGRNGTLISKSKFKNFGEFYRNGSGFRDFYNIPADKNVLRYYKKLIKKYRYLEKEKGRLHDLYIELKNVRENFSKGARAHQPEFLLEEKKDMKKKGLMRDDVTFVYRYGDNQYGYILGMAMETRISDDKACVVIYKDMYGVSPRKFKHFDHTSFYGFRHKDKLKCVVALFVLEPKRVKR